MLQELNKPRMQKRLMRLAMQQFNYFDTVHGYVLNNFHYRDFSFQSFGLSKKKKKILKEKNVI